MKLFYDRRVTLLVVGVGLGMLTGLLLAPRPGKEMRRTLRHGADEGIARLRRDGERFRSTASSWLTRLRGIFCDGSQPPP
jgi:gas vesicle protein